MTLLEHHLLQKSHTEGHTDTKSHRHMTLLEHHLVHRESHLDECQGVRRKSMQVRCNKQLWVRSLTSKHTSIIRRRRGVYKPCGSLWTRPVCPSLARCSSCPGPARPLLTRRSRRRATGRRLSCSGWTRARRMGRRGGVLSPSSSRSPLSVHKPCSHPAARYSAASHGECPPQSENQVGGQLSM